MNASTLNAENAIEIGSVVLRYGQVKSKAHFFRQAHLFDKYGIHYDKAFIGISGNIMCAVIHKLMVFLWYSMVDLVRQEWVVQEVIDRWQCGCRCRFSALIYV